MSPAQPTINTYLSDMIAFEQHMLKPLQHQVNDQAVQGMPEAHNAFQQAVSIIENHIQVLESRLEAVGGHAGASLKEGVASALGDVASAIGNARKTEVAKYVRDDYTAFCMSSASYSMLHTTALALHDEETARIAERHLGDAAQMIMDFGNVLPSVVLSDLEAEGVTVDRSILPEGNKNIHQAWSQASNNSKIRA